MPTNRNNFRLLVYPTEDLLTAKNFSNIEKFLATLGPLVYAQDAGLVDLAVGDNDVVPSVKAPIGRLIVYQSAVSNIYDKGLQPSGRWRLNASVACTVRLLFF